MYMYLFTPDQYTLATTFVTNVQDFVMPQMSCHNVFGKFDSVQNRLREPDFRIPLPPIEVKHSRPGALVRKKVGCSISTVSEQWWSHDAAAIIKAPVQKIKGSSV